MLHEAEHLDANSVKCLDHIMDSPVLTLLKALTRLDQIVLEFWSRFRLPWSCYGRAGVMLVPGIAGNLTWNDSQVRGQKCAASLLPWQAEEFQHCAAWDARLTNERPLPLPRWIADLLPCCAHMRIGTNTGVCLLD
jgi:hypothetical protein